MKPNDSQKQDLKTDSAVSKSLLKYIQDQLQSHSESPYLDALVLLGHFSAKTKTQLIAHPNPVLSSVQTQNLEKAIQELREGKPLPYILGEWEFYNLRFKVTPDVLIPRPETEGLVELALDWFDSKPDRRTCIEIGTGSGCIAISLAKSLPDLELCATDISSAALSIAQENAIRHGVEDRIQFLERDLLNNIDQRFDLLIANLPYIPTDKLKTLAVFQTEPTLALDGGQDGLHYIKNVLRNAGQRLHPNGVVLLELDEDCGKTALTLAKDVWPGMTLHLAQDLSGQDRYLSVQL